MDNNKPLKMLLEQQLIASAKAAEKLEISKQRLLSAVKSSDS